MLGLPHNELAVGKQMFFAHTHTPTVRTAVLSSGQVNARQLILDAVEEHFDRPCQVIMAEAPRLLLFCSSMYACTLLTSHQNTMKCLRT
jgi:hypothetical protein